MNGEDVYVDHKGVTNRKTRNLQSASGRRSELTKRKLVFPHGRSG
jgi:hypothetical protein